MITTVTLNTSIDKMYRLETPISIGDVMRIAECRSSAGGKGLNVARVIGLCKEAVTATGLVGGHNGHLLKDLLRADGIPFRFVEFEGETRSCINIITPDKQSTEFLEPGCAVGQNVLDEFMVLFEELIDQSRVITISGSLPKGIQADACGELVQRVKAKGKKVILDTSGVNLEEGIKALPDMIKPNRQEMEALLGTSISDFEELLDAAVKLHNRGIAYVVVSLGKDGAVLVCDRSIYHGRPPKLQVANTVGCGDSMVAALAVGLERGLAAKEMLQYAVAVSAANALTPKTGDFKQADFDAVFPRVVVEEVHFNSIQTDIADESVR